MPTHKIQVGQVWKHDSTGQTYLVTKLYSEALATFALLRRTGAEGEAPIRVRVERKGQIQSLPGYSQAQGSGEF